MTSLLSGLKFSAGHYTTEILERIPNSWKEQGAGRNRKMIIHADSTRPHTAKLSMGFIDANRMTRVPHPPYSPDLALSDCFLFGDVKRQPSECPFEDADDLLTAVQESLDGFEKPTFIRVVDEWVWRVQQSIETQGEYVG
jgi:histone-lysine N-methyltransferase SETMAR